MLGKAERMTQKERMEKGLIYLCTDRDLMDEQAKYMERLWEFNRLRPSQQEEKERYMKETFAECGEGCYIELPFRANWGGRNLHLGNHVYANFNLTVVDDGDVYIDDYVQIGPNVVITTANHPIDPELREQGYQFNKTIRIGRNAWIGSGTVIVPGVTIGENAVIGAGSVVTRDIPDNVVAVGDPCRVMRRVGEHDSQFFYRDERIDWENL